jgi:hypothetical protein
VSIFLPVDRADLLRIGAIAAPKEVPMRRLFLAATLLAAPAAGADRLVTVADPELRPAPTVRLACWDPERILSQGFDEMAREVQAVFRPIGIEIVWRHTDGESAPGELNVIFLSRDPARAWNQGRTMGRVNRHRHDALWIYVAPVRETLDLAGPAGRRRMWAARTDYPRALARVVAHELVHTLVPDEPHAASGLMQASLSRDFLTAPRAPIDRRFTRALARGLSAAPVAEPARVATDIAGER